MTTEKHTPTPWVREHLEVRAPAPPGKHYVVATAHNFRSLAEAEANAALIVALRNNLPRIQHALDLLATQEAMVNEVFGLETGDE